MISLIKEVELRIDNFPFNFKELLIFLKNQFSNMNKKGYGLK